MRCSKRVEVSCVWRSVLFRGRRQDDDDDDEVMFWGVFQMTTRSIHQACAAKCNLINARPIQYSTAYGLCPAKQFRIPTYVTCATRRAEYDMMLSSLAQTGWTPPCNKHLSRRGDRAKVDVCESVPSLREVIMTSGNHTREGDANFQNVTTNELVNYNS